MPFKIDSPGERAHLEPRDKPYYQRIGRGLHVGYRKGKTRTAWVIRWQVGRGYKSRTLVGIVPDDQRNVVGAHVAGRQTRGLRTMNFRDVTEVAMDQGVYYCSFCKKSSEEVDKLVAGPDVYICNECVKLCQYYMDHPDQKGKIRLDDQGRAVLDSAGNPIFDE